ncbi:MAG: insulinase family protein [Ignavibacteriae bacterium]|nr:MAG: insulinase family protein [Ignavibacteriota bacterium]
MKSKPILSIALQLGILLAASTIILHAQLLIQPDQRLSPDPKILIGQLDNGLRYYIRENHKPEKRAELRLAVRAGSILEDDDQQGLAHFDEHMAFNGTKNFPKQEIIDFLEKSGIRFGADLNAYTSFDETVYMMQVPTDSPLVLKKGFQILEEWSHDVSYDDKEIDNERGVVIEEWRLGRGAEERVSMKHIPVELYQSHYADRLTIGKKEILESCTHDALRKFYRDWYRPDLMAVFAVGDFKKEEIEKLVKEHFTHLTNPLHERERRQFPVPDNSGTLVSIATDPELTRTSVDVIFKRDTSGQSTAADYRREIISSLSSAMLNARLRELLQKPNPPFLYAYNYDGRFIGPKCAYYLSAGVKENSILGGLEAMVREAFRVKQHGFTGTELERQKVQMLRGMENAFDERDKTESRRFVDEYIRNFLIHEPIPGIEVELNLYKQFLPGITLQEVNTQVRDRMKEGNRVMTISAPQNDSVKVPTEAEVLSVMNNINAETLDPYIDNVSTEPLLAHLPAPGSIVEEKTIASLGVTELKLSNGARVILKPTDFKNDEVLFSAYAAGGTSLIPDSNYLSATIATSLIQQSGIGSFDATALQKKLAGKIVSIGPSLQQYSEGFTGRTSPQDIETLFQLVTLYATSPRRDSAAFSSLMTRYHAMLQNRSVSPEAAFSDTFQVTMGNYHFRARPWTNAMLKEIQFEKALSIYEDRFADFSNFIFFFVGNLNVDSIKPLIQEYLASLPSLRRQETWKDIGIEPPKGIISKQVRKGIEPKSSVVLAFNGPFEWSQQNRYMFNSMLEVLNIKLREVLREDKGGTYGVGASGSPSRIPRKEYDISIRWGCDPVRVDELVNTVMQQIDSAKLKPFDPVYIEKVQETQRRGYEVNLKQNGFWMSNLRAYYSNDENLEMMLNYPKLVDNLNAAAIQSAVKKYFDMRNMVKVVLVPEKMK